MSSIELGSRPAGIAGAQDDRPLNEQELQLVQRLLSDPFSFPIAFKTWLVSYLESSDLNLPLGAVEGLVNILGITGVGGGSLGIFPAGIILPYGGSTAPVGALICDGASYLRADQTRLFSAIGTAYGAVDGTHFNVPDLRGRVPVGLGTHADVSALGNNDGQAVGNRRPKHQHTPHSHTANDGSPFWAVGGAGSQTVDVVSGVFSPTGRNTSAVDGGSGNPNDALDTPSHVVINFVIIN